MKANDLVAVLNSCTGNMNNLLCDYFNVIDDGKQTLLRAHVCRHIELSYNCSFNNGKNSTKVFSMHKGEQLLRTVAKLYVYRKYCGF